MRLFLREAAEALAADGVRREALARAAVGRYGGELLPGDRYAAWAAAPREELRRRLLDLLDLLADEARERGELDEAIRLLDQGIAHRAVRRGALPGVRGAAAAAAPPRQRPQPRRPRGRAARLAAPAALAAPRPAGGGDEAGGGRAGLTRQPSGPCELWICRHAGQSARRLARCSSTSSRST